jgi:hypothetical protein
MGDVVLPIRSLLVCQTQVYSNRALLNVNVDVDVNVAVAVPYGTLDYIYANGNRSPQNTPRPSNNYKRQNSTRHMGLINVPHIPPSIIPFVKFSCSS